MDPDPHLLIEEIDAWRASRTTPQAVTRAQVDKARPQLERQLERLLDAYQHGAISLAELTARRERLDGVAATLRALAEALAAADGDRERLERATAELAAFAATLREGLAHLDFAGRERLVRLLIERVVVTASLRSDGRPVVDAPSTSIGDPGGIAPLWV